jgi:signal transduction histidine kinase
VRTRTGLRPTPRAEQLRAELDGVLSRIEAPLAGPGAFVPAESRRTFHIAAADYAQSVLLPGLLRELAARASGISVRILPVDRLWETALAEGKLDLRWAPRRKASAGIVWTHQFAERFAFVVQLLSNLLANAVAHGAAHRSSCSWAGMVATSRCGLFVPFRARPRSGAGLGLGLYIVREIARAHGGDVTLRSTREEGTTVEVVLSRGRAAAT